ncbi:L-threonylcarbamoyladenylate synthase [Cytobacillus kochii]|uniref:Threonylcarbamoyl-AMP synthase n=1 Tax=Cytobacillus kochii TaxID=859143 RepID=A0A248TIH2_9BACI|nr:L-threonylcarbamoyladenylate synthase [Cytobacillus kochii]ASV68006.1 threonylcarbamoyl-AMP synthase [Cytobacillus kochii]
MKTIRWSVDNNVDNLNSYPQIVQASDLLKENEVVAFPTETVYGLGGNAKSDGAVEKIFAAKGRPADNPLIIHIAKRMQLQELTEEIPLKAEQLMNAFWPGPLTIILKKKKGSLSDLATAGLKTVGFRMPDHPVALAILAQTDLPIAAPSANSSGRPSPTTADHVWEDLEGKIAGLVDGGATGVGVESTVIDCTEEIPVILRPGGVTKEQIIAVIGEVKLDPALHNQQAKPKSPGMKYTHYAPDAPLTLVDSTPMQLQQLINEKRAEGLRVGVLTTDENKDFYETDVVLSMGARETLDTVAAGLYYALRAFNHENVDIILGEVFPYEGVGVAIMNRLEKAAGHRRIQL